jgi:hypothetical protein
VVEEKKPRNAHDQYANEREQQTNLAPHLLLVPARTPEKEAHQDESADDQQKIRPKVNVRVLRRANPVPVHNVRACYTGGEHACKI